MVEYNLVLALTAEAVYKHTHKHKHKVYSSTYSNIRFPLIEFSLSKMQ